MTLQTNIAALTDIMQGSEPAPRQYAWMDSWNAYPCEDELVQVALYRDLKVIGYAHCYWRDSEWQSDCGDYSWPRIQLGDGRAVGMRWRYFDPAPRLDGLLPATVEG